MKKTIARYLLDSWYKDHFIGAALLPFGFLFTDLVRCRKWLYRVGLIKSHALPVPVIVIGNITVGGTGKTPLCLYLIELLKQSGFRVGVISRGFGGKGQAQMVRPSSEYKDVGDEALLIVKKTGVPMAVGLDRFEAGQCLLAHASCDVILSDDGLQHYGLKRDIEIAVIDGMRRFGNGICLPAGPLREPIERLNTVDFVVVNGKKAENTAWQEWEMILEGDVAVNLLTAEVKPLSSFCLVNCHAVAGIGNPERFFLQLEHAGIHQRVDHWFPDHHLFLARDVTFGDTPVFMTEKDAVKCHSFATHHHWVVPVSAQLPTEFTQQFLHLLNSKPFKRVL
jgi:tetraacyldisaccharide 4'-kinase